MNMKKIVSITLISIFALVLASCGAMPDNDSKKNGTMCKVECHNWGIINFSEDVWLSTEYVVDYDGTMTIIDGYTLGAENIRVTQLSEDDYKELYKLMSKMKHKDTTSDGCDGTGWKMYYEEEVKFVGYLGNGKEKKVAEIVEKY